MSVMNTKNAPSRKPSMTGMRVCILLLPFIWSPISRAGNNRDQNEAAVMTPEANPRDPSRNCRCN